MITGTVRLRNHTGLAAALVREHLGRTVAETGRDIAETTRENMYPGHFLDTGMSQDETCWSQITALKGAAQVPSKYAAYPEFGTAHMASRPVLIPAILQHWPSSLHRNWRRTDLPPIGPLTGLKLPISRTDRRTGQGYP